MIVMGIDDVRAVVTVSGKMNLRDLVQRQCIDIGFRIQAVVVARDIDAVSYTHLRAHETVLDLVCRLLLEKKKNNNLQLSIYHEQLDINQSHYATNQNDAKTI